MNPTVTTPAEPTHFALTTPAFREVCGLISEANMQGGLAHRLLTVLSSATGANFNAPADTAPVDLDAHRERAARVAGAAAE